MEHLEQKSRGALGNPRIHRPMAGGILDRAFVFSSAKSQPAFCVNRISVVAELNDSHYLQSEYKELLYEKRGI